MREQFKTKCVQVAFVVLVRKKLNLKFSLSSPLDSFGILAPVIIIIIITKIAVVN